MFSLAQAEAQLTDFMLEKAMLGPPAVAATWICFEVRTMSVWDVDVPKIPAVYEMSCSPGSSNASAVLR